MENVFVGNSVLNLVLSLLEENAEIFGSINHLPMVVEAECSMVKAVLYRNISSKELLFCMVRATDKICIFIPIMHISSPKPMFDDLLESSQRDDSNKWSNIGFGDKITQEELIEDHFMHLIWCSDGSSNCFKTGYHLFLCWGFQVSLIVLMAEDIATVPT